MEAALDKFEMKQQYAGCTDPAYSVPSHDPCGTVVFTPHQLPCDYIIRQETHVSDQGYVETYLDSYYIHGTYAMALSEIVQKKIYHQILVRTDIRDPKDGSVAVSEIHTNINGSCNSRMVPRSKVNSYIHEKIHLFTKPTEYSDVSDGKFEGKPCKVYYKEVNDIKEYLYVDSDNYIIGSRVVSSTTTRIARYSYENKAPLNLFVIDQKRFSGCFKSASVVPVIDTCLNPHVDPHVLPCDYVINMNINVTDNKGSIVTSLTNIFNVYGTYYNIVTAQTLPVSQVSQLLVRPDVEDGKGNIAVYQIVPTEDKCVEQMRDKNEILSYIHSLIYIFLDPLKFEAVMEGTYKGVPCYIYHDYTKGTEVTYYVKDKYIIALTAYDGTYFETAEFTFDLHSDLKDYAFDKNKHPGCDDHAYTAPTNDVCHAHSSSHHPKSSSVHSLSSSQSSIVTSSFSMIIATVVSVCVLVSLF